MNEQMSPDQVSENELICEKLLGWHRWQEPGKPLQWKNVIDGGRGWTIEDTLRFTTWAEAGLILEAMADRGYLPRVGVAVPGKWYGINPLGEASYAATGPLVVRAAALEYIKAVQP